MTREKDKAQTQSPKEKNSMFPQVVINDTYKAVKACLEGPGELTGGMRFVQYHLVSLWGFPLCKINGPNAVETLHIRCVILVYYPTAIARSWNVSGNSVKAQVLYPYGRIYLNMYWGYVKLSHSRMTKTCWEKLVTCL